MTLKQIIREAFMAGVRNGGDSSPADHDYEDIQKSVAIAFEHWWQNHEDDLNAYLTRSR